MSRSYPLNAGPVAIGTRYWWPGGGTTPLGTEYTIVSYGYGRKPIDQVNKRVNGKYPPGGDWIAWERVVSRQLSDDYTTFRYGFGPAYKGKFFIQYPGDSSMPMPDALYSEAALAELTSALEGLGAEGYARARPAQPDFSLATSIAELKDIPGQMRQAVRTTISRMVEARPDLYYSYGRNAFFRKDTKTRLSHTAEWYLALEFGWLPILRDMVKFMESTKKSDDSLKQLLRDEGRPIKRRRRLQLDPRITYDYTYEQDLPNPSTLVGPILVTQCYPDMNKRVYIRKKVEAECFFVAQFRYWLPDGPRDFPWEARLRRRMLGSRVTPSVAWNLMPWTFLSDYFSSLGKAIGNLGPGVEEQLITDYCYVTYTENVYYQVISDFATWGDIGRNPNMINHGTCGYLERNTLKMRVAADPFAFRFFGGSPSLKQTAILAALAGSR